MPPRRERPFLDPEAVLRRHPREWRGCADSGHSQDRDRAAGIDPQRSFATAPADRRRLRSRHSHPTSTSSGAYSRRSLVSLTGVRPSLRASDGSAPAAVVARPARSRSRSRSYLGRARRHSGRVANSRVSKAACDRKSAAAATTRGQAKPATERLSHRSSLVRWASRKARRRLRNPGHSGRARG